MIGNDWDNVLNVVESSEGFKRFLNIVDNEYKTKTIYPLKENIFNAFKLTPYKDVKVVIVGQDPYHGEGEAHGLSFSVQDPTPLPPSLKNIYKELYEDLGINPSKSGDLTKWAKEGVLLLNSTLTVVKDTANSHSKLGWANFTDYVIKVLNQREEPIVFILWGNFARSKKTLITNPKHLVIESAHPSPLSARNGFFGSKPFSKTNKFLKSNGIEEIDWKL
ncbi:MAG: uracil-DNA glycosylase [Erysipelotrichales bacterium]|nr:uracil-DNA glycosylase [Erysipelotrichales bacterium]